MKKSWFLIFIIVCGLFPLNVFAQRGCCSHHGGVAGCGSNGRTICKDGTYSPSCTCTPPIIYGCTDVNAENYNKNANRDNGSCKYIIYGCTDKKAINYDQKANTNNGTCQYEKQETEISAIPYSTDYESVKELEEGMQQIKQEGIDGKKQIQYKIITDANGNVIEKSVINEQILEEAKPQIIMVGTKKEETRTVEPEANEENEEDPIIFEILLLISIFLIPYYHKKNPTLKILYKSFSNSNKKTNIFLKIVYFILVIPSFVDIVIILKKVITQYFAKKKEKEGVI